MAPRDRWVRQGDGSVGPRDRWLRQGDGFRGAKRPLGEARRRIGVDRSDDVEMCRGGASSGGEEIFLNYLHFSVILKNCTILLSFLCILNRFIEFIELSKVILFKLKR